MLLNISLEALKAFLDSNEDCEMLSEGEYVADLFMLDEPITVNLRLEKDGCAILAAAKLLYDEEQDGWYMGDRIEDENEIMKAFEIAVREEK